MDKKEVISFFNKNAPNWDEYMIRDNQIIDRILQNAGVSEGKHVSIGLLEIEKLVEIFSQELEVIVQIADNRMYQVVGKR